MKTINVFAVFTFSLVCIFLLGCQTTYKGTGNPYSDSSVQADLIKKTNEKFESEKKEVSGIKYGRFRVEMLPNGDRNIIGGHIKDFKQGIKLPFVSDKPQVITINYLTKELILYSYGKPVVGYAVVTPSPDFLPQDVVRGIVKKIVLKPSWGPTPNIRKKHPYLPAGIIPYGHEYNWMGEVKFEIDWGLKGWEYIRIHGTEGYAEDGRFWELETFGCTRLQNDAILNLVKLLGPNAEKEIEVIAHKTPGTNF